MKQDTVLFLENCYNVLPDDNGEWEETGKTIPMRWILPHAIVDFEEEEHEECIHYVVTIEFSEKHFDWNAQRLRFGPDKETALEETKKIVDKLTQWTAK